MSTHGGRRMHRVVVRYAASRRHAQGSAGHVARARVSDQMERAGGVADDRDAPDRQTTDVAMGPKATRHTPTRGADDGG